jgi:hypothetical protein
MPGALGSREKFLKQGISILEIWAPGKAVPRAHLSGITGRGEEMVHHLDVAVLRGRGVRNRARIKSICREGDKGVRLESKTVECIQVLFSEFQTVQEERPQTFMTDLDSWYRHAVNKATFILLFSTLTGAPPGASYGAQASLRLLDVYSFRSPCAGLTAAISHLKPNLGERFDQSSELNVWVWRSGCRRSQFPIDKQSSN